MVLRVLTYTSVTAYSASHVEGTFEPALSHCRTVSLTKNIVETFGKIVQRCLCGRFELTNASKYLETSSVVNKKIYSH